MQGNTQLRLMWGLIPSRSMHVTFVPLDWGGRSLTKLNCSLRVFLSQVCTYGIERTIEELIRLGCGLAVSTTVDRFGLHFQLGNAQAESRCSETMLTRRSRPYHASKAPVCEPLHLTEGEGTVFRDVAAEHKVNSCSTSVSDKTYMTVKDGLRSPWSSWPASVPARVVIVVLVVGSTRCK